MTPFILKISSPDGDIFSGECTRLTLRAAEGDLAVMAGHIPFVSSVKPCNCKVEFENGDVRIGHTEGGILNVSKEKVLLLSGSFSWNE